MINIEIEKYYKKLLDISISMTKDEEKGIDLLHIVLEDIISKKPKSALDAINNNLFSYYIYRCMVNQYHSSTSKYHYLFRKHISYEYSDDYDFEEEEYDIFIDENFNRIIDILHNNFTWYEIQLFKLYYLYELRTDLNFNKEDYSTEEIKKLRKISYRKLQEETKIYYVSIQKTVTGIVTEIKNNINNMKKCDCGKEYIRDDYYQKHIKNCDIYIQNNQILEEIDEKIEESVEIDPKIQTKNAIKNYFSQIKEMYPSAMTEWKRLFEWYSILVPKEPGDVGCMGCRRLVYNTLKCWYDDNK